MSTSDAPQSSRILVIDDEVRIHQDFQRVLTPPDEVDVNLSILESAFSGEIQVPSSPVRFEVNCALTGREGLEMLKTANGEKRPYGLAFVDLRLGAGWDGLSTIRALWQEDHNLQVELRLNWNLLFEISMVYPPTES